MKQIFGEIGWFVAFMISGVACTQVVRAVSIFVLGGLLLPIVPLFNRGGFIRVVTGSFALVLQIYFWATWAAFCAESARLFISIAGAKYLYWYSAFMIAPVPLVQMTHEESQLAESPAASAQQQRHTARFG